MMKKRQLNEQSLEKLITNNQISAPLWIQFRHAPAQSIYPAHGHAWGEFIYAFHGVMEINIDQIDYIPPSSLWHLVTTTFRT